MEAINQALAPYGATINAGGFIERNGKALGVKPVIQSGRLRFETADGGLLASGRIDAAFVDNFVQRFWFWTKQA